MIIGGSTLYGYVGYAGFVQVALVIAWKEQKEWPSQSHAVEDTTYHQMEPISVGAAKQQVQKDEEEGCQEGQRQCWLPVNSARQQQCGPRHNSCKEESEQVQIVLALCFNAGNHQAKAAELLWKWDVEGWHFCVQP